MSADVVLKEKAVVTFNCFFNQIVCSLKEQSKATSSLVIFMLLDFLSNSAASRDLSKSSVGVPEVGICLKGGGTYSSLPVKWGLKRYALRNQQVGIGMHSERNN